MATDANQQGADREIRLVKWPSDLKAEDLLPWKLAGHEELGRPFRYELLLLSNLNAIKPDSVVGNDMTVVLDVAGLEEGRYFNGYVDTFENLGVAGKLYMYRAVLRPWTWLLTKRSNCRVFQGKSAVDILKLICGEDRYKGYSVELDVSVLPKDACRERDYCVQYRETDFDFISRLLEEEGIYYYFVHEKEKHKMVLCSEAADHGPYFGGPSGPGDPVYCAREEDNVDSWVARMQVTPGSFRHRDYDFQNPSTYLENQTEDFDVYEYPARCAEPVFEKDGQKHAKALAAIRSEELTALSTVVEAKTSAARGLVPGHKFKMEDHPDSAQNREYLVAASDLEFEGDDYGAQLIAPGEHPAGFKCGILAIPADTQFRPARTTARPRLPGLQTATVVGSDGSTADLGKLVADKLGRVWLRFHWDLEAYAKETGGKGGEYHACPVRVAQPWAGCGFGALFMPRVGDEVAVAFIDGDPDRPLVVGSVYNGVNTSPYDPAKMSTVSAIQSRSIDTTKDFNEIRFDDKKGEELLYAQAQKDLEINVKNDRRETVVKNRHLSVKKDKFEHVEHNRNEKVDADHIEEIGKDRNLKVKGKEAKEVGESLSLTVKGDMIEVFKKNHGEQTTDDYYLKAKNIVIEATENITLTVGGSHIAIEPGGIEIHSGAPVKMDGTEVEVKGTGSVKVEGAMVDVKGSAKGSFDGGGMTEIKGGIVKIN